MSFRVTGSADMCLSEGRADLKGRPRWKEGRESGGELISISERGGGTLVGMKSTVRTPIMTLPVFLILQTAGLGQALAVPAGQKVVLTAEGRGSQIYKCDHVGTAIKWVFVAPEAKLFANNEAVGTHGAGPMWTVMGGSVHGRMLESLDSPEATAVPWLLLQSTSSEGTGPMRSVSYIQRTDTKGGKPPAEGCDADHLATTLRVPYTATYTFYAPAN
jgi:hypothetical protein